MRVNRKRTPPPPTPEQVIADMRARSEKAVRAARKRRRAAIPIEIVISPAWEAIAPGSETKIARSVRVAIVGLRLRGWTNNREHWTAADARKAHEKATVRLALSRVPRLAPPLDVVITIATPRAHDDDWAVPAAKYVRDEVARWIFGRGPADPAPDGPALTGPGGPLSFTVVARKGASAVEIEITRRATT